MNIGDLVRSVFNPNKLWLILKVASGDDIPPVVRNPDNKNEMLLEVADTEGVIMHIFNYECEVVSCK